MSSIIKIHKIKIEDFKNTYQNPIEIDFEQNTSNNALITIENHNSISGNNGVGKTTILDAITFIFTNKLWNNTTSGYQPLDDCNNLIDVKPFINLIFSIGNQKYEIVLKNGSRYFNDIKSKSFIEFKQIMKGLNIDCEKFVFYSNPHCILELLPTKEARALFIDKIINEEFKKEVEKEFINNEFVKEFDQEEINYVLNLVKTIPLNSINSDLNSKLKSKEMEQNLLNNQQAMANFSEEDFKKLNELDEIESELSIKNNKICNLDKTLHSLEQTHCPTCHQEIKKHDIAQIAKLNDEKIQIKKEIEEILKNYNKEQHFELRNKKIVFESINKDSEQKLKAINVEINKINNYKLLAQKYTELLIESIENRIKKHLPIELKLFHFSKEGTVSEVFTVLQNGIDYKFLNTASKIRVGTDLIDFLTQNDEIKIPILIDNGESLDSFESMKNVIICKVKQKD